MKKKIMIGVCLVILCVICSGCLLNKEKEKITLTIWHVYGGQTDSPLNDSIDKFNQTVGKEKGIFVQVTSVTNTNTIGESVLASANHEPGASELPDMFVAYPKTVLAMPDEEILVDYRDYFTEEELNEYIPEFLEEGIINEKQLILPIAKSTEVMFINKTAFDRFALETGAKIEDLKTWEGLFKLAEAYTSWSDEKTPEVENDGKTFFAHDYHFNYFQVGVESLGEAFFEGNEIVFGEAFEEIWNPYAQAALKGGVWLQGGYATEPLRTGDAIVSVASSASILYYSDIVTYEDNTSETIEIISMPCPVFENGEKLVMQRGAGICTVKSDEKREKAACTFLKWLSEPDNNVEFVTKSGYMPVSEKAFTEYLPDAIEKLDTAKYVSLYKAFQNTQEEFQFYTAPQIDTYHDYEIKFEEGVRLQLQAGRNKMLMENADIETMKKNVLDSVKGIYGY